MKGIKWVLALALVAGLLVIAACAEDTSELEDIKWVLTDYSVDGDTKSLLPDTRITVLFDSEDKEVTGSGGCNTYFGSYELDGNNLSIPGPIAVTEMWCGDEIGEQESAYLKMLQTAESYEVEGDKLTMYCEDAVLIFKSE